MNSLQREMGKRMLRLERKIQKAIRLDQGDETPLLVYSSKQKTLTNNNPNLKSSMKPIEKSYSNQISEGELIIKNNSSEKKRLKSNVHQISSYN